MIIECWRRELEFVNNVTIAQEIQTISVNKLPLKRDNINTSLNQCENLS